MQDSFCEPRVFCRRSAGSRWHGAQGYVLKSDAERELLEAVNAVLRGVQFVSGRFAGHDFTGALDLGSADS
jgi:hypothetical protein